MGRLFRAQRASGVVRLVNAKLNSARALHTNVQMQDFLLIMPSYQEVQEVLRF